jgi:hypothetical protein
VSEELENSLLKSIETYLDERLRVIDEQLARLQTEFNDAFGRLRENAAASELANTPLQSAISAHLQAAREQKLSGAAPAPPAPADLSLLKNAINDIKNQRTQSDVLGALLRNSAHFADRAVLFVIKSDQAIAWRMCEASNRNDLQAVSGVALPLWGSTVISQAARAAATETSSGTRADDASLVEQLGGEAQQLAAVPLVVRKKVVAVLYADSAWPHREAIQLDALEVLTQVGAIAIELVSSARVAQPPQVTTPTEKTASEIESPPAASEISEAQAEESGYAPHVEPATEGEYVEPTRADFAGETEAAAAETPIVEAQPEVEAEPEVQAQPEVEPEPEAPAVEEPPTVEAPVRAAQPAEPVFTAQYATPLGSSRRYGSADADLPVDVSDEERRLHNDARRFARLLVSEIKLYNEQKVSEGRNQGDIYERLREDIDRSRQMYEKRVAPPVAARHDYFHQELVNTLAEGDPAKLDNSYPGAAVGVA